MRKLVRMAEVMRQGEPALGDIITGEILALMGRNRVSQTKLSRAIGMTQPQLSERLNGRIAWRINELEAIASYFKVTVGSLLDSNPRVRWFMQTADQPPCTDPFQLVLDYDAEDRRADIRTRTRELVGSS